MKFDVIVAGGGFAGVGAAVAAARQGCSVLLVEQSGALGGAASNCLVMPFMPYWTEIGGEKTYLVRGIFREIVDRMGALGTPGDSIFHEAYLRVVLDELMRESGAQTLFHATITGVKREGGKLRSVSVATVGGTLELEGDVFVDATGDANLTALSGAGFSLGREADNLCQPMTLCFRVSNVSKAEFAKQNQEIQAKYKAAQANGAIKNPREDILWFTTFDPNVIHFNSTRVVKLDPTDAFALSRAETEARAQMLELFLFLKKNFACFENAEIVSSATSIGVRESRMAEGEHRLTGKELVGTVKFPDAVAAGNYDIDIHNPEGSGTSHYYFPAGQYYTIPYRSLVVKAIDNLLVAGRCIACDHEAQASIRIMPICCATGEAAGVGAAVSVRGKTAAKDADIGEIQRILRENGAFF